jgi:hypothetical protein
MIERLGVPHPNPLPKGEGTETVPQNAVGEGGPQQGPFLILSWQQWSPGGSVRVRVIAHRIGSVYRTQARLDGNHEHG